MYNNGEGVLRDDKQAVYWYKKAAEQGNARAQHNLGMRYIYGEGVIKSYKNAAKWIRAAYENGGEKAEEIWNKYELWKY